MTPALRNLDIVLDALVRGESPSVVVLADPRDALCHPGLPATNARYCRGCRCGACRAAHNTYTAPRKRAWRQARRAAALEERSARLEMRAAILRSRMTAAERAASS